MITVTLNNCSGRKTYTGAAALGLLAAQVPPPLGGLCDQVTALRRDAAICTPLAPAGRATRTGLARRLAARIDAVASVLPPASAVGGGLTKAQIATALGWKQWPVEQALAAAVRAGSILRRRGRGAQDVTYTLPGACK